MSKYIEFSNMTMAEFANSNPGTVAKFFLKQGKIPRMEVSKSLKAACSRQGRSCSLETRRVLIEGENETWNESRILTAILN